MAEFGISGLYLITDRAKLKTVTSLESIQCGYLSADLIQKLYYIIV